MILNKTCAYGSMSRSKLKLCFTVCFYDEWSRNWTHHVTNVPVKCCFFLVFPSVTHVKQRMSRRFMKMTASLSVFQVHPTESQYRDYKRSGDSFWSKLEPVKVDTAKLEHLFETKSKEISVTKVKRRHLNGIFEIISLSVPLYVPLLRQAQLSSCWHTAF